jgi:hypothetical protein
MADNQTAEKSRSKLRTEVQKRRRADLQLARADDRRAVNERAILTRYNELKAAMRRAGLRIGPISDIVRKLDDPIARFEMLRARVDRWDALWSITLRKRETRGKIIIGGAVLARVADMTLSDQTEQDFLGSVVTLLDERVPRVRDRLVVRELLNATDKGGVALALRPGGPLDETLEQALAALGETLSAFELGRFGGGQLADDARDDGDLMERVETDLREG